MRDDSRPVTQAVPVTEARAQIADLVGRSQHGGTRTVLTKHGRPVAAVVPVADLDRLLALEADSLATSPFVVRESVTLAATSDDAWGALVSPLRRQRWWPAAHLEDFVGGAVEQQGATAVYRGEVLQLIPGRMLVYTWREKGWPASTTVRIELTDTAADTVVGVLHTGWEQLADGARLATAQQLQWRARLDALRALT